MISPPTPSNFHEIINPKYTPIGKNKNQMKTKKMNHGHHGANHPVKNLEDGSVLITSQNHGFCIDDESMPANVRVTHQSLFDGSLQGIHLNDRPAFGFQGHPEASPGPHDAAPLFDHFIELIRARNAEKN